MQQGSFTVFGLSTPVVKAGEVVLPLVNGARDRLELRATPSVMRQIVAALNRVVNQRTEQSEMQKLAHKRRLFRLSPAKLAKYQAAFAEWQNGDSTQRAAATKHGLPYGTFVQWIHVQRLRAEAATQTDSPTEARQP